MELLEIILSAHSWDPVKTLCVEFMRNFLIHLWVLSLRSSWGGGERSNTQGNRTHTKKRSIINTQGKPKAVMGRFYFPFAGRDISH